MKTKKIFSVLLAVIMIMSLIPMNSFAGVKFTKTEDIYQVSNTETAIAPGVSENKIIVNDSTGNNQVVGYAVSFDSSNPTIKLAAGYADNDGSKWKMQTVRAQANAYMKDTGENVVAAFNTDIFNMGTGEPTNVLVMNGVVYKKGLGKPYFGVTKSGEIVMGASLTQGVLDTLQEATVGFYMLLENGVRVNQETQPIKVPKTAVGRTAEGKIIFYVADGRNYPISNGLTDRELTSIMIGMGCVDVFNFDGGGSTTYLARYEGEKNLGLKNKPSDAAERDVASSLFIISTAKPSGVFDHANLTPNNLLYTPESVVEFAASGSDSSGAAADLPSDGKFALADTSFGTITDDGVFTSNGKTGTVTVNYISGGAVSGTTSIDIVKPDYVGFADEEVSLDFEEESTLGLVVKYMTRDVNYTAKDIKWTVENPNTGAMLDDGLTFFSDPSHSCNGKVTATSVWDESVSGYLNVIVGMLPTVVWDFEDITDENGNVVQTAEDYYGNLLTHSNYGRGGKESLEIVSLDDDEPVRFGTHSLKMNFDFTECGAVTEGACIGSTEAFSVPGNPTGIGVYVYVPEGVGITYNGPGTQAGLWLRGYGTNGAGQAIQFDYTLEPNQVLVNGQWTGIQPGLSWSGWSYCEASLAGKGGAPYGIQKGMTFRLMFVNGTKMGTRSAGSIYFDNLQFVYGTNIDDVDNPIIDSMTANGAEIKNGTVIDTNTITFDSYFHDVQNKYTTGIDAGTIRMYVDGVAVANNDNYQFIVDPDGSKSHIYDVMLENGEHSVTTVIRDGFGNETSETRYFKVEAEETTAPLMVVGTVEDTSVLGKTVSIAIRPADECVIEESVTGIIVGNRFTDYTVTAGDKYDVTTSYSKLTKVLTVKAKLKDEYISGASTLALDVNEAKGDTIATVTYKVPSTLNSSATFDYTIKQGSYKADGVTYTYSADKVSIPVTSAYTVTAEPTIVGNNSVINVKDTAGNPVADATIIYVTDAGEQAIGTTDENGVLVTDRFSSETGDYKIYAKDADGVISFQVTIGTYTANGDAAAPYGVMNNAVTDPKTMKSVSWLSNPSAPAQTIQYRVSGTEDWTTVNAKTKIFTFTKGGHSAVNINSVTITDLEAETEYEYRVGSEAAYSDVYTFITGDSSENTRFFVVGDMQSEDIAQIEAISNLIAANHYDFGIQTGDMVDDTTMYQSWEDVTDLLGVERFGSVDTIHVMGNHEYAGDGEGEKSGALYNLPSSAAGGAYSTVYGNVYVAVINYTGNPNEYREALKWVVADAKASDATWKILSMHQPAYYTNDNGGNAIINSLVPAAAEEAGINMVFSGHDHAYARTAPMTGGKVDEENGIVYFIAGSSGEKKYTVTNKAEFNFQMATQDYDGVYISVEATKHTLEVITYNSDGNQLDSYTMKDACERDGHDETTYYFDKTNGTVCCGVCDDVIDDFTGVLATEDGTMYFVNGVYSTGWVTVGEDCYYFGENGIALTGTQTITTTYTVNETNYKADIKYHFDNDGKEIGYEFIKCPDGNTRAFRGGVYAVGWREIDGNWYFFTSNSQKRGKMFTGRTTIYVYQSDPLTYTFSNKGELLVGAFFTDTDGNTVYYWGPNTVTGWQTIEGKQYYFDEATGYMVKGEVEIDGETFSFDNNGVLKHNGTHNWETITAQKGSCTDDEILVLICKDCSFSKEVTNKALGHIDADADGKCDICGKKANSTSSSTQFLSLFSRIYAWFRMLFARIRYFFTNLA